MIVISESVILFEADLTMAYSTEGFLIAPSFYSSVYFSIDEIYNLNKLIFTKVELLQFWRVALLDYLFIF